MYSCDIHQVRRKAAVCSWIKCLTIVNCWAQWQIPLAREKQSMKSFLFLWVISITHIELLNSICAKGKNECIIPYLVTIDEVLPLALTVGGRPMVTLLCHLCADNLPKSLTSLGGLQLPPYPNQLPCFFLLPLRLFRSWISDPTVHMPLHPILLPILCFPCFLFRVRCYLC